MSVIIKGMEMPKTCDKCELMTANYGCAFVGAVGSESYRKRAWDCPLVEVPERKRGKWKFDVVAQYDLSYGGRIYIPEYRCNQCGHYYESYVRWDEPKIPEDADFPNFCENCGVIMDGMDGDSDV